MRILRTMRILSLPRRRDRACRRPSPCDPVQRIPLRAPSDVPVQLDRVGWRA